MQHTKEKLVAQQLVLFHLGFYTGTIDGIWSDASIKAKQTFEADEKFLPAYPNGGLPFGERDKLPKRMVYGARGKIEHLDLTPERSKEIMAAMDARTRQKAVASETAEVEVVETKAVVPEGTVGPAGGEGGIPGPDPLPEDQASGIKGPAGPNDQKNKPHNQNKHHHQQTRG